MKHSTITTTPWILVVPPCAPWSTALLHNDEILALVLFQEVDCRVHTRDARSNDDDRGFGMVFVTDWHLRPRFIATHHAFNSERVLDVPPNLVDGNFEKKGRAPYVTGAE